MSLLWRLRGLLRQLLLRVGLIRETRISIAIKVEARGFIEGIEAVRRSCEELST